MIEYSHTVVAWYIRQDPELLAMIKRGVDFNLAILKLARIYKMPVPVVADIIRNESKKNQVPWKKTVQRFTRLAHKKNRRAHGKNPDA